MLSLRCLAISVGCLSSVWAGFPRAEIHSRFLAAGVYLPDTRNGYYRGTRFDWCGVIYSLQFAGHEFFGEWFDRHDPLRHDAITGPVNVFRKSLNGQERVEPGKTAVWETRYEFYTR